MASAMSITVLCPNGRRQIIKVSPNTSILEVLEEACRKQGLKPDDYDMCHYNKSLDLSLSVRFANLPNNAMLELQPSKTLRQEGFVTVALQLESGERLTSDFSPSSTLWDVVNKCMSSRNESAAEQELPDGEPVCIYMRQKFMGNEMKTTTLRSVGLTGGKAILRLIHRPSDSFSEQAHVSVPLSRPPVPVSVVENTSHKKVATTELNSDHILKKQPRLDVDVFPTSSETPAAQAINFPPASEAISFPPAAKEEVMPMEDEPMQFEDVPTTSYTSPNYAQCVRNGSSFAIGEWNSESMELEKATEYDVKPKKEIGEIKYLGPRNAVLFNLEDVLEIRKDDFPDEFFELTINDVRYLMDEYKRARNEMENEPLLLKRQRENRLLQQLARYKQSVIRVYFPDQLVLQGTFIADETVQSIVDFVRNFLEDPNLNFYIYIAPPKIKLVEAKTLMETRLVPAAVVYFGCDTPCTNYLREDIRNQISDPRAASIAASECRKMVLSNESLSQLPDAVVMDEERTEAVSVTPLVTCNNNNNLPRFISSDKQNKVPTWFKIGKK